MRKYSMDSLTGLKGLFSLLIVFYHTLPQTPLMGRIPLTSLISEFGGLAGNYFFFIASGFLIALGYRERIGSREISFQNFMGKRLCKLYPLYLITNMVALVAEVLEFGWSGLNLKRLAMTVLLQAGGGLETMYPYNGPAWFISALCVCYLVYFFMAYHAKNNTQYFAMIALGIIWGYSITGKGFVMPLAFAHHGDSFFAFFTGCALAGIYLQIKGKLPEWSQVAGMVILAGSAFLMLRYGVKIIAGDVKVALAFVLWPVLIWLAIENRFFSWFLQSKPLQYLGKISFSIYLWHFVVYVIFRYVYTVLLGGNAIGDVQYPLYLILVFAVSILSHRFLERK